MTVFVDTSALYARMDSDDSRHADARTALRGIAAGPERLETTNYVVVETAALVQRRLGSAAVRALFDDVLPSVDAVWVDPEVHGAAVAALLVARGARLSLVDLVSFEVMRRRGIRTAFTFDADFAEQGFEVVP